MQTVCKCSQCQSISEMIEEELSKEDPMDFDIDVDESNYPMPETTKAIAKIKLKKKPWFSKKCIGL